MSHGMQVSLLNMLTLDAKVSLQKLQHARSYHSSPQYKESQSIIMLSASTMPESHTTETNEFTMGPMASKKMG
jgi:hypothetical protein